MSEQVTTNAPDPADVGSRIDPVLARSWLLVNGAHDDRFEAAVHSRADIVVLDIEDAVAPKDKSAARDNVVRWLERRKLRLGAHQRFRHPLVGRRPEDTGRHVHRRRDAGDGRIGRPRHRDRETTAQCPNRGARRNGTGPGAHHRDRRDQGDLPARLRHRRFPPRHRFRGRPRHPRLRALPLHHRRQGCPPAQRDRRADHRLQRAQAHRGHGRLHRVRDDRQDLPRPRPVFRRRTRGSPRRRTKLLGRKSFSPNSSATGARFATGPTCHASPGPPRSSSWLAPTASRCPTSTTSRSICPPRRTRTTTESGAAEGSVGAEILRRRFGVALEAGPFVIRRRHGRKQPRERIEIARRSPRQAPPRPNGFAGCTRD